MAAVVAQVVPIAPCHCRGAVAPQTAPPRGSDASSSSTLRGGLCKPRGEDVVSRFPPCCEKLQVVRNYICKSLSYCILHILDGPVWIVLAVCNVFIDKYSINSFFSGLSLSHVRVATLVRFYTLYTPSTRQKGWEKNIPKRLKEDGTVAARELELGDCDSHVFADTVRPQPAAAKKLLALNMNKLTASKLYSTSSARFYILHLLAIRHGRAPLVCPSGPKPCRLVRIANWRGPSPRAGTRLFLTPRFDNEEVVSCHVPCVPERREFPPFLYVPVAIVVVVLVDDHIDSSRLQQQRRVGVLHLRRARGASHE